MEPWLQYATTSDGVSIAYTVAGSGKPLVRITGGLWDHAQGYWRVPPMRRQLERLATYFTHIQYDARGTGLSQRGVADFRIEAQLRDLDAVVAANRLERFDLLAHFTGGFAALSYAARNPDKVAHMVLLRPHLRGSEYFNARVIRAMAAYRQMAAEDWLGYLSTVTNRAMRFEHPDIARHLVSVYSESMTPETIRLFEEQYSQIDVSDTPEKIACPTLILDAGRSGLSDESWREVAARIPNVSLQMVKADMPLAYMDDATDAVLSFLGEDAPARSGGSSADALQVLLFVAVQGGQADYQNMLSDLVRSRGAVRFAASAGGYVAAFRSAQMALETAIDLQQAFTGQGDPAQLRIGVDALDPSDVDATFQVRAGERAQQASESAGAGEVVVTDVVRQLVTGKGFLFAVRGGGAHSGSDEPLNLYELRWRA